MYRLIYKSSSAVPIDKQMVRDILYTSLERNRDRGITGVLLATNRHFLQILEGEFKEVNETFFRISQDRRHTAIQLIAFGPEDHRLFDKWTMKGFGLFNLNIDMMERLREKYGTEGDSVRFPLEAWSCLSLVFDVQILGQEALLEI